MKDKRVVILLLVLSFTQQGCLSALINAPFQIIGNTIGVLGELIGLVGKLPIPPGVIPGVL